MSDGPTSAPLLDPPSGPASLAEATRPRRTGPGTSEVVLDDRWDIGGAVNGGFLLALVARAAALEVPAPMRPLAVSAHYVAVTRAGRATVRSTVVRAGRSSATVSSVLEQGGRPTVVCTLTFTHDPLEAREPDVDPPDLLPVPECLGVDAVPRERLDPAPFMRQVDLRADPRYAGWILGRPTGRPELRAWMSLRDGADPDLLTLLLAVDCLPPVTFELGRFGWAPTVQISAYLRGEPAPGRLRVVHRSTHLDAVRLEEDCEVWDASGRLVAQGRQLALAPR